MPRSLSFAILAIFLAAFSAAAQSPESGSSQPATQPPQDSSTSADAKKPKKVWNNENLSGAQGPVSIVGDPKNKPKTGAPKPADAQYIASARQKLEKLQKQIDDANKELADLKKFSQGDSSANGTGIILYKNYKREPIAVQIRALEDKKKDLQAQIDALLDEARKKGVEPGQLR
jgi:chaperonin cofactor prefoldin